MAQSVGCATKKRIGSPAHQGYRLRTSAIIPNQAPFEMNPEIGKARYQSPFRFLGGRVGPPAVDFLNLNSRAFRVAMDRNDANAITTTHDAK